MPSPITRQTTPEEWSQVTDHVRNRWQNVDHEELDATAGDAEKLVELIQTKTGEAREQIEAFVSDVTQQAADRVAQLRQSTAAYSAEAADVVRESYDRAAAQVQDGVYEAQQMVRRKPTQAVALAFGAGIVAGLALSAVASFRNR